MCTLRSIEMNTIYKSYIKSLKFSLCLTKHYAIDTYEGVDV
jgi:hypothetical protein